jgi:hypothetical protein
MRNTLLEYNLHMLIIENAKNTHALFNELKVTVEWFCLFGKTIVLKYCLFH